MVYMDEALRAGMREYEIAAHLGVPAHRVMYFNTKDGRMVLESRSEKRRGAS